MIIDYCSDLHLDHYNSSFDWKKTKSKKATVLMIAGDCANDIKKTVRCLKDAKQVYEDVIYVDGNHDHYMTKKNHQTVSDIGKLLFSYSLEDGWYYLPYRDYVKNGVAIIGNCGWYDWKCGELDTATQEGVWCKYMNDYRCIDFGMKEDTKLTPKLLSEQCYADIKNKLSYYDNDSAVSSIITMTHTIPHKKFLTWSDNTIWNTLNGSYINSEMENLSSKKLKHWVFGHTHYTFEDNINGVKYHCNPRGYPSENHHFSIKSLTV